MVNLKYDDIDMGEVTETGNGAWYTIVGFGLVESKKILGFFNKNIKYGETLFLAVVSENMTEKPNVEEISEDRFKSRLIQKKFDKEAVTKYINEKVSEAAKSESTAKAYEYLEQFFSVED